MRPERIATILLTGALLAGCGTLPSGPQGTPASKAADAARIHVQLGQRYLEQGKLDVALEKLQKAIQYDPGYVDAHTVIAVLYDRIGDTEKAEKHYRRATELTPKAGAVNNNYGGFLCRHGRYEQAEKHFQRAIADPFYKTPDVALANAGTCQIQAGHPDAAEAALRRALEINSNNGDALFQLAAILHRKQDDFHARAFIQRFEGLGQVTADALLLGRQIELALGNTSAAEDYARRLRQQFPDSEQVRTLDSSNPP